ncbi:MAG: hypothetical protein MUE97_07060 [Phycisphaerales bacterium]|nr:hypothetical protein [Phycisphaerales bacterium]
MMTLYLASDLLWASKIKGTADALGLACRPARDEGMLRARLGDCAVKAFIVDLEAGPVAIELIGVMRREAPGVRVIAFGPHVATEMLAAAQQAGAERVMTRGAFAEALPNLLQALA